MAGLYTGGLFHIFGRIHLSFKGFGSYLSLLFYFKWIVLLTNNINPDQMPLYVASDLGLHCLSVTFLRVSQVRMGSCERLHC